MRHIKVIVPKFHEYPLIISRCFFVIYILIRNGLLTEIERLNSDLQNTYFTEENIRKYAKYFPAKIPDTIDVNTVISEEKSPVPEKLGANNLGSQMNGEL